MKPSSAACALVALLSVVAEAAAADEGRKFDGALTLSTQRGTEYVGARKYGVSVRPGFFLRWGRLSVSSGGGWASVRHDDEIRGLGLQLRRTDDLDLSLGLRSDSGRDESSSDDLRGLGDAKRTIRVRIGGTWRFAPDWRLGLGWTIDAFNRGGGNFVELKVERDWRLTPRLELTTGSSVTAGGPRYMQTYFGVTAEQSVRSGYAVYDPGTSLRDLQVYTTLRADIGDDWVGLLGLGLNHMLGDAADSPLTRRTTAWGLNVGIGWRF